MPEWQTVISWRFGLNEYLFIGETFVIYILHYIYLWEIKLITDITRSLTWCLILCGNNWNWVIFHNDLKRSNIISFPNLGAPFANCLAILIKGSIYLLTKDHRFDLAKVSELFRSIISGHTTFSSLATLRYCCHLRWIN